MTSPFLNSRDIGIAIENNVCHFLIKKGLHLVTKNYRCRSGEIDLIMKDGNDLVFVEIRFRSSDKFGGAIESVNRQKQQKLLKTAQFYLLTTQQFDQTTCRFDIVAVSGSPTQKTQQIEWIKNAFQA